MNKYIRLKSFRKIAFTAVLFTGLLSASHSTQANEIDQNDGTALKQASRLSQEIAGSSLFDLINIMPPELQSGLASQMPLPELLKLNRTADDVPKGTLKVGPVLVDIIPAQFHQAIERLFTITQNEGGSLNFTANTDLDDDIVAIQAEHLMQVLRALYDHQYYKINDDVYNQVISRFQNHYLWKNGDLETFY